jgi:uncharacterized membrane protein HdeD (DUF308 family)
MRNSFTKNITSPSSTIIKSQKTKIMKMLSPTNRMIFWPGQHQKDAINNALAKNWLAVCGRGAVAILFGIMALWLPFFTISTLLLLFGFYMLLDGALATVAALRAVSHHQRWGFLLFESVADFAMAGVAILAPSIAMFTLVIVIGVWAVMSGGLTMVTAYHVHQSHGRVWLALSGLISVIWGFSLYLWPMTGAMVLTWWLGSYAIFFGVALLGFGLRLRSHRHAVV